MTDHTRPEMAAERKLCGRIVAKIMKDPCGVCIHRGDRAWDRTFCKVEVRTYFGCRDGKTEPTFEPDQTVIGDAT